MKKMTKWLTLLLCGCMLAGCGAGAGNDGGNESTPASSSTIASSTASAEQPKEETAEPAEIFTISMMQELFSDSAPDLNNEWYEYIRENLRVDLAVDFIPTLSYVDSITTTIADKALPMVIAANGNVLKNQGVLAMMEDEEFWDLTDIVKDYPNLYEFIGESRWETSAINGVNWGIPRLRVLPRNGAVIRQDWLDNLGLAMPTTFDELYEVLKAFTYNDPDGNGVDDTYGVVTCYAGTGNRAWNGFQTLAVAYGAPNTWAYKDGTMVPDFGTDEYIQAIQFMKKLYDDGIMNQNFNEISAEDRKTEYMSGKYGMVFCVIDDISGLQRDLVQAVPTARSEVLAPITVTKGADPLICATSGYNGLVMFPKYGDKTIQTEEDLRKVLAFFDALCTEEYQQFLNFGLEGLQYEVVNGVKSALYTETGASQLDVARGDIGQILPVPAYLRKDDDNDMLKNLYDSIEARMPYVVLDDRSGLTSATYNENSSELDTMMMDAAVNYVIGDIDEAGYRAVYDEWLKAGGQDVIDEFAEAYEQYK